MIPGAAARPAGSAAFVERNAAWRWLAPLNLTLLALVLAVGGLRLARPNKVFYYTEGVVVGSLAALERAGDLSELYPADGWTEDPTVLTLYPPVYFVLASGVNRLLGREATLLGPRLLSAAALLTVLLLLGLRGLRAGLPAAWGLALIAGALLTPAVYTAVAGAQPDALALLWTWIGIASAAPLWAPRAGAGRRPWAWTAAGGAFLLAFFTKQSFIAAPAAFTLALFIQGRRGASVAFGAALSVTALVGIALLDRVTGGGYAANTIGALAGSFGWENLLGTLAASEPLQWVPLGILVGLSVAGSLRPGFPELYLVASVLLHTAAMLKAGSSVNYLLEPTLALLLLAAVRGGQRSLDVSPRHGRLHSRTGFVAGLAVACVIVAGAAGWREYSLARPWFLSGPGARVAEFEGSPLVDPMFTPAVLDRGMRPWLNDPFAFGVLLETGRWDASGLQSDLRSGEIPFVLALVDLGLGPVPRGVGSSDLVMAYFWRAGPIWRAITEHYEPVSSAPIFLWIPKADR